MSGINITSSPTYCDKEEKHGYFYSLGLSLCFVTIIVSTVVTNFIVVVVFVTRENRKRSKNIYLANLSLIDLIIGVSMMPTSMLNILNRNWNLPGTVCRVHLVTLHSLAFASLLAVLLVSVDRWYSICYPFTYRVKPTGRIALYAVIASWSLSFLIHIPFVGIWDIISDRKWIELNLGECLVSKHQHVALLLPFTLFKYAFPHLTMLLLKCSLYKKIKQRKNVNVRRSISSVDTAAFCLIRASMSETAMNALAEATDNVHVVSRVRIMCPPIERRNTMELLPSFKPTIQRPGPSRSWSGSPDQRLSFPGQPVLFRRMSLQDCLLSQNSGSSRSRQWPNVFGNASHFNRRATIGDLAKNLLEKQDSKAAWFLSLLLITSVACWTPWTVFSLCYNFFVLPKWMYDISLWILLANSTANPFLYGLLNKDFRKVVSSWLLLEGSKQKRLKTALRMLSWQMAWGTVGVSRDRTMDARSSLTACKESEEF